MAFASQQSIAHATTITMKEPRRGRDLKPCVGQVFILLTDLLRLPAAVFHPAACLFREACLQALNKISCWLEHRVVCRSALKNEVTSGVLAMASAFRAVYERGSPPRTPTRSPTRSVGLTIGEAAAKGGCVFLLKYSPERLTKTASLRKGFAVRGAVAFQGDVDVSIQPELMSRIKTTQRDPERVSIFEPGTIDFDRSIANAAETQRWELVDVAGQPQQEIETIIVEEAVESESAYGQRILASSPSRSSASSASSAEPASPTSPVVLSFPGRALLEFFEQNQDPQEEPAAEQPAGEESVRHDTEGAEGLPVGRLLSEDVRRLVQTLHAISNELGTALYDRHLPPRLVASCQRAEDAALGCAESLEGKGLTCDEVDLSSSDSRRIQEAINMYCAYLHDCAEADDPRNDEFWALHFSGRSQPFLPWIKDEWPAEVGIGGQEGEAAAKSGVVEAGLVAEQLSSALSVMQEGTAPLQEQLEPARREAAGLVMEASVPEMYRQDSAPGEREQEPQLTVVVEKERAANPQRNGAESEVQLEASALREKAQLEEVRDNLELKAGQREEELLSLKQERGALDVQAAGPSAAETASQGGEAAYSRQQMHDQAPTAEAAERAPEIARLRPEAEELGRRVHDAEATARASGDQLQAAQQARDALLAGMHETVTSAGEGGEGRAAEQPELEKNGQEASEAEGESTEWLPVGPQKTAHLRRLKEGLEDVAFELQIAPFDIRFPPSMEVRCGQAAELADTCSELLGEKDLSGDEADLSLSESQQIREAINAYASYTVDRAEADSDEANREFWGVKFGARSQPFLPWIEDEWPPQPRESYHVPEEEGGGDSVVVTEEKLTLATRALLLLVILKWSQETKRLMKHFLSASKLEATPKITARREAGYYQIVTARHGLVGRVTDLYALPVTTHMDLFKGQVQHQVRFSRDSVAVAPGYPSGDFYKGGTVEERLEFVKADTVFLHVPLDSRHRPFGSKSGFKAMPVLQLGQTQQIQVGDFLRNAGCVPARDMDRRLTGAVIIKRDDGMFVGHKKATDDGKETAVQKHGVAEDGESGGNWRDKEEDELGSQPALALTNQSVSSLNYAYGPEYSLERFQQYEMTSI